jgi:hypothetical protein
MAVDKVVGACVVLFSVSLLVVAFAEHGVRGRRIDRLFSRAEVNALVRVDLILILASHRV